jgi:16S rRNA (guanine527-N7)-methyltransferase
MEWVVVMDTASATRGKLSAFLDLLEKWNQRINLSGASSRSELEEHLEDSLHVVPQILGARRVLDVGSGGGFPVVVAAISLPETAFVALEPVHKKHAFLRTAARELSLANLTCLAERLEDHVGRDYDAVMSRATFDISEWLSRGSVYVASTGIVIGFEAQLRSDLENVERIPYELHGKSRALVLRRP